VSDSACKWRYWLPVGALAAVITVGTSLPARGPAVLPHGVDKVIHACAYGMLALLLGRALIAERGVPAGRACALAFLLVVAYGALDEIHQSWIPGRDPSIWDWAADAGGAAAAQLAVYMNRRSFGGPGELGEEG